MAAVDEVDLGRRHADRTRVLMDQMRPYTCPKSRADAVGFGASEPATSGTIRRWSGSREPSEAGPYTIRVRVPHGVKLMPHPHPEDRVYTVIFGVFFIGLGD